MRRFYLTAILAFVGTGVLCAGTINLPVTNVNGTITFNPGSPNVLGGGPFGGSGSVLGLPIQWDVIMAGTPTYTGPLYLPGNVNMNGSSIQFNLTDAPGTDSITGNIILNSVVLDTIIPNSLYADVLGTITVTSATYASPNDAFAQFLTLYLGQAPTAGFSGSLAVEFGCFDGNTTFSCLDQTDPTGQVVGAQLTLAGPSGTPEPATGAMLLTGCAAVFALVKRRRSRS